MAGAVSPATSETSTTSRTSSRRKNAPSRYSPIPVPKQTTYRKPQVVKQAEAARAAKEKEKEEKAKAKKAKADLAAVKENEGKDESEKNARLNWLPYVETILQELVLHEPLRLGLAKAGRGGLSKGDAAAKLIPHLQPHIPFVDELLKMGTVTKKFKGQVREISAQEKLADSFVSWFDRYKGEWRAVYDELGKTGAGVNWSIEHADEIDHRFDNEDAKTSFRDKISLCPGYLSGVAVFRGTAVTMGEEAVAKTGTDHNRPGVVGKIPGKKVQTKEVADEKSGSVEPEDDDDQTSGRSDDDDDAASGRSQQASQLFASQDDPPFLGSVGDDNKIDDEIEVAAVPSTTSKGKRRSISDSQSMPRPSTSKKQKKNPSLPSSDLTPRGSTTSRSHVSSSRSTNISRSGTPAASDLRSRKKKTKSFAKILDSNDDDDAIQLQFATNRLAQRQEKEQTKRAKESTKQAHLRVKQIEVARAAIAEMGLTGADAADMFKTMMQS